MNLLFSLKTIGRRKVGVRSKNNLPQVKSRGFTLIEIVLVLAIAGLIFVIVFLAVSAAQRARRDTARKNDMGRLRAAVEQYSSNNGGALPTSAQVGMGALSTYLTNWEDPSTGAPYVYTVSTSPAQGQYYYYSNWRCSGAMPGRNYAIWYYAENGGVQCVDNR